MTKIAYTPLIFLCALNVYSQSSTLVLTKNQRNIQTFYTGSHFTFQLHDGEWFTGIITKITADSIYMTKEIIHYYGMGIDTSHFSGFGFSFRDVNAIPTKKEIPTFSNDHAKVILGHEKFVWIRNGFLFRATGAGYTGLNIINSLLSNDPPFAKHNLARLGIGTAVFLFGEFLHHKFSPYLHLGKKYKLKFVAL